jgi:hypothetical protein
VEDSDDKFNMFLELKCTIVQLSQRRLWIPELLSELDAVVGHYGTYGLYDGNVVRHLHRPSTPTPTPHSLLVLYNTCVEDGFS